MIIISILYFIGWWLLQVLVALDQLVNAICFGWADETISSRSHRWYKKGHWMTWLRYLVNMIFWWQEDHCRDAYESERQGRHQPPEARPRSNNQR